MRRPSHPSPCRCGFTLIELLVVIAIIAVLVALLPAVQKVREAASMTACKNNLKQLALGAHAYHDLNNTFPAGSICRQGTGPFANSVSYYETWSIAILPHIEQGNIYNLWSPNTPNIAPDAVAGGNFVTMRQAAWKPGSCSQRYNVAGATPALAAAAV